MTNATLVEGAYIETYDQMNNLPIGSIICESGNESRAWEKREDNLWHGIDSANGSGPYNPDSFSMGRYNQVLHIPTGPRVPPPQETLLQFMWKFRSNAISGTHENGTSMEATMKGMRLLGITDDMFPLGPGVKIKTLDDRHLLPREHGDRELHAHQPEVRQVHPVRAEAPVLDDPAGSGWDGSGRGDHGVPGDRRVSAGVVDGGRRREGRAARSGSSRPRRGGSASRSRVSSPGVAPTSTSLLGSGSRRGRSGRLPVVASGSATGSASVMRLDSRRAPCSCTGRVTGPITGRSTSVTTPRTT